MKIVLASDHAGFLLKGSLIDWLGKENIQILDVGTFSAESVDYPDFAENLCRVLLNAEVDMGILICSTGIGMSISANRFRGIRAALCLTPQMAYAARHHNNANVLVIGAANTDELSAQEITAVFVKETFDGERHARRIKKMDEFN